jgi:hypothetical protein
MVYQGGWQVGNDMAVVVVSLECGGGKTIWRGVAGRGSCGGEVI